MDVDPVPLFDGDLFDDPGQDHLFEKKNRLLIKWRIKESLACMLYF